MASLREIADSIRISLQKGSKGNANFSFSIEHMEFQVGVVRNHLIKKYTKSGEAKLSEFSLDFPCLPVSCKDIAECCDGSIPNTTKALRIEIPKPTSAFGIEKSISYIGPIDMSVSSFPIYTDHTFKNHKFRAFTGNSPYVWVNDGIITSKGTVYAYLFGQKRGARIKKLTVNMAPENPYAIQHCTCIPLDEVAAMRFPIPEAYIKELEESILHRYVNIYNNSQPELPNTGTSNLTV